MAAAATESRRVLRAGAAGPAVQATTSNHLTRVAAWFAAGLAAVSVPLHGWMLVEHSHGVVLTVLMAAMTLGCLGCAVGVVRRVRTAGPGTACPRTRALRHLWVMAAAMALLHVALLTGFPGGAHQHGSEPASTAVVAGAGLMLAIVALEVVVCFACAVALRSWSRTSERRVPPVAQSSGPSVHGHQPSADSHPESSSPVVRGRSVDLRRRASKALDAHHMVMRSTSYYGTDIGAP